MDNGISRNSEHFLFIKKRVSQKVCSYIVKDHEKRRFAPLDSQSVM